MGEVKEAVKGKSASNGSSTPKEGGFKNRMRKLLGMKIDKADAVVRDAHNLCEYIGAMSEEVSRLVEIKDDDVLTEGDAMKADNVRKAAHLRSVHSLLSSAHTLLEDY